MEKENKNCKAIDIVEYKKILLKILINVDDFCRKNNIKYYLTSGTLLGAVRHKGFIPWDDDIDIAMMREDYNKFISSFNKEKSIYKVMALETDDYYNYPYAKVIDERYGLIEDIDDSVEICANIDLFPLDGFPGTTINEAKCFFDKTDKMRWRRNFKIIKFSKNRSFYKNVILFFGKLMNCCISQRKLSFKISSLIQKYSSNEKSPYVAGLCNSIFGYREILDKSLFEDVVELEFEGHKFMAPIGYDNILSSYYGNYMEFPPVEKRVSHHKFKCWYKNN